VNSLKTLTGEPSIKPGETPVEEKVKVQGFRTLPRPSFHQCFSAQDWKNAGVAPNECCVPILMYSTDDSLVSRESPPTFRQRSTSTASD
ncbi:hypothetical protein HAX54_029444, partial [Datura stramonium]|nr:hypothetical protein [Datura stramonium]